MSSIDIWESLLKKYVNARVFKKYIDFVLTFNIPRVKTVFLSYFLIAL